MEPHAVIRRTTLRLVRIDPLSAVDAPRLSAALAVTHGHPSTLTFICGDDRPSSAAADIGGFAVM